MHLCMIDKVLLLLSQLLCFLSWESPISKNYHAHHNKDLILTLFLASHSLQDTGYTWSWHHG